jgi:hypothetical protein
MITRGFTSLIFVAPSFLPRVAFVFFAMSFSFKVVMELLKPVIANAGPFREAARVDAQLPLVLQHTTRCPSLQLSFARKAVVELISGR